MSSEYQDLGAVYEIFAGQTETFSATIIDPNTGLNLDLSDTTIYNTMSVKIVKPNNNIIGIVSGTYVTRPSGFTQFTVDDTIATNNNLGNYIAQIELYNEDGVRVLEQISNFNILRSR